MHLPADNIDPLSLEEEQKWLQQALRDISFLEEDGTQGHAIIAAGKMQNYLNCLQERRYPRERVLESYLDLKSWLKAALATLRTRKMTDLTRDYAQFGSDILR